MSHVIEEHTSQMCQAPYGHHTEQRKELLQAAPHITLQKHVATISQADEYWAEEVHQLILFNRRHIGEVSEMTLANCEANSEAISICLHWNDS